MNILVIGLGSMGKRRIRLLKELDSKNLILGVDSKLERQQEVEKLYGISTFFSIEEAKKETKIDCAFVCTPPLSHSITIKECLENRWNVFTELNLVSDGYEENINLAETNGCVLFLSSTFCYREEIGYLRSSIRNKNNLNYIYHVGQYLPDWHPWENYRDFFVKDKRTNGCREIMAIELPWIIEAFGKVIRHHVIKDKMSGLKIEYSDNYLIQLEHENGNKGMLIVDIVCPVAVRNLEVYGEKFYLSWNGNPSGLRYFDKGDHELKRVKLCEEAERAEGYSSFIVENAYRNEIQEFMKILKGTQKQQYGLKKDLEILKLIDQIEEEHE